MSTIDISAGTIHYEATGPETGRPVVFVHGYMMGGQLWRRVSERLAGRGLRCIAPTWPLGAHPKPLRPGADQTIGGVAGIVADVLAALELKDVVLVGNDTGGVVTQLVAVHYPERLGALVLTSCDAFEHFPPPILKPVILAAKSATLFRAAIQVMRAPAARNRAYAGLSHHNIDHLTRAWVRPALSNPAIAEDLRQLSLSLRTEVTTAVATMSAILLGLEGCQPETITTEHKERRLAEIAASGVTRIGGVIPVPLTERDIDLHPDIVLPTHPNGMTFTAAGPHGRVLATETYFSVGGGFIVTEQTSGNSGQHPCSVALPYVSAQELLDICDRLDVSISEAALRNETCCRTENEVRAALLHLRDVMVECEQRSIAREGLLPGGLRVRRRAKVWYDRLNAEDPTRKPEFAEDWVNLVALAVNEENASGGRVVTAPTNGAAGIVPAVLHYAIHYTSAGAGDPDDVTVRFLLTAGAIGSLFKERASISGAEVGCQGEVGSAAAMAAAGLAEILGGTPRQVENAAEIAMEHSLGLTCDPIAGLVQIPCIERNAISAGKAINAARMALRGDGIHRVTLDQVIDTMRATGADMHTKYKETSAGGLAINVAVNIVEC